MRMVPIYTLHSLSMRTICAGPVRSAVGRALNALVSTLAIAGQVPLDTLWHAVPSFPTVSEVWLRLMEAYGL